MELLSGHLLALTAPRAAVLGADVDAVDDDDDTADATVNADADADAVDGGHVV